VIQNSSSLDNLASISTLFLFDPELNVSPFRTVASAGPISCLALPCSVGAFVGIRGMLPRLM
jgi:hypothetical protein